MRLSPLHLLCLSGFLAIFGTTMAKNSVLPFFADASPAVPRGTAMGLLGSIMDIGHSAGPLAAGMVIAV
jgi:hypothetical protein